MFVLPHTLNMENVEEIRDQFLYYLQDCQSSDEIVLDAAALRDIDAAGLQFLLSVFRTLTEKEYSCRLINKTPFIQHVLDLSGAMDVMEMEYD